MENKQQILRNLNNAQKCKLEEFSEDLEAKKNC